MWIRGGALVVSCWLVWAGCDKDAAKAGTGTGTGTAAAVPADCGALGDRMAGMVARQMLPTPTAEQPTEVQQTTDRVRAVIAEACTRDRWSEAMVRCGLAATADQDCGDLLTVEQRHGLETRLMQTFAPTPP